jgi:hypothetical protein
VLEAQNIGAFFTDWLAKGKLRKQPTAVGARRTGNDLQCLWTVQYVLGANICPVQGYATPQPLSVWLMSELGSIAGMDCLTVLMKESNRIKNSVSHHTSFATSLSSLSCPLIYDKLLC